MMKTKYYFLLAALSLLLFLVVNAPAAFVISAIKDKIPQVTFQGVNGTIWQGSAQQINVRSKYVFKNVDWSICAAHLLLAEACIQIELDYKTSTFDGQLSIGVDKFIQAKDINIVIKAKELSQLISLPIGEIDGDFFLQLKHLNWQIGGLPSANGILKWNKASITIAETAHLGDITINLSESEAHLINASISNSKGHLSISGQASADANSDYTLDLSLTPNKGTSTNLKNSLSLFAKPQSNGSYKLMNSGNLKSLGLM